MTDERLDELLKQSLVPEVSIDDIFQFEKAGKKRFFKSWTSIAAVAAIIVILGGGLAFAAINHFWSDGMKEVLEMNETQMQTLEEQGNIQMFDPSEAVTVDGVTVRPMEMVADSKTAAITFLVSGVDVSIGPGEELRFETFRPELDDGSFSGASAFFYDDKITDENGTEGFEFVVHILSIGNGQGVSLLGRQLHIELGRLVLFKGETESREILNEGTWEFDISFPEEDPATIIIDTDFPISDTVYTVDTIELSPLFVQVYYQVNGDVEFNGKLNGVLPANNIPIIYGIRMKDGTVIDSSSELDSGWLAMDSELGRFLHDDPEKAVWDEKIWLHPKKAFVQARFRQVIDPEEVAEVILRPWGEAYVWGDLPDETVAAAYGGKIPFERVDVNNIEYWYVPLE